MGVAAQTALQDSMPSPSAGDPRMTPKLRQIFALFRPCCKTRDLDGLPAARAARTIVEELIWLFSLAS